MPALRHDFRDVFRAQRMTRAWHRGGVAGTSPRRVLADLVFAWRLTLEAERGAGEAGGRASREDDPLAGEDLVVGQRIAPRANAEPVDPKDEVGTSGGVGADEVGLLGEAVAPQARRQDRVEHGLGARDGEPAL